MIKSGHINMKLTLLKKSLTSFLLVSMSMFSANSFGYTPKDLQGIWQCTRLIMELPLS